MIAITKNGSVIYVNAATLDKHLALGWSRVVDPNVFATQDEVNAGVVPDKAISPETLAAALAADRTINTVAASGAAQTLDVNSYAAIELTLTDNCTLTLTDPAADGLYAFVLYTIQGGAGGFSIVLPGTVLFEGGTQPSPATTAGTIVKYVFTARVSGGVTTWDVTMSADGLAV